MTAADIAQAILSEKARDFESRGGLVASFGSEPDRVVASLREFAGRYLDRG